MNEYITLYKISDLTDTEYDAITDMLRNINILNSKLSLMTREQRIDWFRKNKYPNPIDFKKEIGGTVYTVNSHFSRTANETLRVKSERIIMKYD